MTNYSRCCSFVGFLLLAMPFSHANAEDSRMLALSNDSAFPVVIVLHTPSNPKRETVSIPVPAKSVVYNVPIPNVVDDQFAITYAASGKGFAIKPSSPRRVIGYTKLFQGIGDNEGENNSIPLLQFRDVSDSGRFPWNAMTSPLFEDDALRLRAEWTRSKRAIDYQQLNKAE